MNLKKLMNIMFSTALIAATFTFSACGTDPDDPTGGNGGGNYGGGESTESYYIKHPWGTGTDDAWSWQQMSFRGNGKYTYAGEWGGVGANINTAPDDGGANWFAASSISGASNLSKGTFVTFTYDSNTRSLSVEGSGSSGGGGGGSGNTSAYYIKHPWGGGEWSWQPMSLSGNTYTYTGVWGGTGANINTSANDNGADWFPESNISGASSVSVGTTVTFSYSPSSKSLSLTTNGGGGTGGGGTGGGGGTTDPVPSAPTNLTASQDGSKANPFVYLTWDYNSGADHYVIYRSTSQYGTYSQIGTNYAPSYSDENISNGKTYYYKVTAANSSGKQSDYSNVASVTINTTIVEPPAQPNVTKVTFGTSGLNKYITITWDYVVNGAHSAPDEVKLSTKYETTMYTYYVFDWTKASSKKKHTIYTTDIIGSDNNVLYDQPMELEVKNSAGEAKLSIIWRPREDMVLVGTGSSSKEWTK